MKSDMNTRLTILKTVLWSLIGVLVVVSVARFLRGLGAATALSDAMPWGYWNALKMAVVALAAGGFVLAGTVYIFGLEKYRSFLRPAILTAFLGYITFVTLLLYDLGLPWNIWHPIIYPQEHSVLFEVAICVMLYLSVLALEFAPVILEYRWFDRPLFRTIHTVLKKVTIPLVIMGIVLSTLHQSSLGSLFLITPSRTHPLWYSPIIWILFLVSAVGLGLMVVTAESFFSAYFFRHKLRIDLLSRLGRAASVVLFIYAGLRLGDLALRGSLGSAFDGSWQAWLFLFEISLSALIPATLLLFRRVRTSAVGLGICTGMTVLGMIGYRFDVSVVAFLRRMPYFPTWMEFAISLGIVAGVMLVFIFFVERLKVYTEVDADKLDSAPRDFKKTDYGPGAMQSLLPDYLGMPRRYSLAAVTAAAATIAFLPADLLLGTQLPQTPVSAARTLDGRSQKKGDVAGHEISSVNPGGEMPPEAEYLTLLSIDGNRNGRQVLFPHGQHIAKLGKGDSCNKCHHLNMPFDINSSCFQCHRDMYATTDIFDHAFHVDKLAGNDGCAICHQDSSQPKTRDTTLSCAKCHQSMMVSGCLVKPPKDGMKGFSAGYMDAMHGLCISCHERKVRESPQEFDSGFAECANCHQDVNGTRFHQMRPSATSRKERP